MVMPILEGWEGSPPDDFPTYAAGSWGPEAAAALLARDGRHWIEPVAEDEPATPAAAPAAPPVAAKV